MPFHDDTPQSCINWHTLRKVCYRPDMQKTQELPESEYLVSSEVMELAKISRRTLERYVADGKLPTTKIGGFGSRRYQRADVEALLRGESSPTAPSSDVRNLQRPGEGVTSISGDAA